MIQTYLLNPDAVANLKWGRDGQYLFSYLQGSYVHLKSNNGYQTFGTVGGCSETSFRVESLEFQKLKTCPLNIALV